MIHKLAKLIVHFGIGDLNFENASVLVLWGRLLLLLLLHALATILRLVLGVISAAWRVLLLLLLLPIPSSSSFISVVVLTRSVLGRRSLHTRWRSLHSATLIAAVLLLVVVVSWLGRWASALRWSERVLRLIAGRRATLIVVLLVLWGRALVIVLLVWRRSLIAVLIRRWWSAAIIVSV